MPGAQRLRALLVVVAAAVVLRVFDGGQAGAMLRLYRVPGPPFKRERY
jgi:hypothetical protein